MIAFVEESGRDSCPVYIELSCLEDVYNYSRGAHLWSAFMECIYGAHLWSAFMDQSGSDPKKNIFIFCEGFFENVF
jgi:hypothetical protein